MKNSKGFRASKLSSQDLKERESVLLLIWCSFRPDQTWQARIRSSSRPTWRCWSAWGWGESRLVVFLLKKQLITNLETSSTFFSLLIFSMDGCFWTSGFAVIILKYLLRDRLLLNFFLQIILQFLEFILLTTHSLVRVVFGPSRVRVGQKILSLSRVSSTRWSPFIIKWIPYIWCWCCDIKFQSFKQYCYIYFLGSDLYSVGGLCKINF